MKFELEPYHRNVPDKVFLEDVCTVAKKLKKDTLTMEQYTKLGTYHASSITHRFGSWFTALAKAGLSKTRNLNIPKEECIIDLKRVARKLE